jgi:hypothetical protein
MDLTPDELAGVVDIVGPVTREELLAACDELAFKRAADAESFEGDIDAALASYHLIAVPDHEAETEEAVVVVGPAAFPALPDGAEDLPHILDVPERTVARAAMADAAESQFREDAAEAVRALDDERIGRLLDVSYDLEAWGPVDLTTARGHLDEATHAN